MKKILASAITLLSLTACTTHLTDFTMISTKNVVLNKTDIDNKPKKKNVLGEDKKFIFLFIPFGVARIENAVNDALEKGNGDLLVDASLDASGWWFLIGQAGYEIKGTVVNTRSGENQ